MSGQTSDAVMIAYTVLEDGSFTALSIDISHSESNKSWGRFYMTLNPEGLGIRSYEFQTVILESSTPPSLASQQ
ncbi:MAG: transposase [Bdellovibrionales bacterium]|nr:transposase [Bdellovibrionales bacterium]